MAHRTDTLTLKPTVAQTQLLLRHAGARRFAYNACVANFYKLHARKDESPRPNLLWSPFDNIGYFNAFKRSAEAGVADDGSVGLAWRKEVHQQVFEEGAKDFGRAMTRWGAYCKAQKQTKRVGPKAARKVGPPKFSSRRSGKASFRIRPMRKCAASMLSVDGLRVPCLGLLAVRGSTAKLRRRLRARKDSQKSASICHITFKYDPAKQHWQASLAITWSPGSTAVPEGNRGRTLGCDVGIKSLVAVADEDGGQQAFHLQPAAVAKNSRRTKRAQRSLGLKRFASDNAHKAQGGAHRIVSNSEKRALRKLRLRHARIKNIRRHHMHKLTTQLVQTHERFGIEGLHIAGMMKNHCLAESIARQAWGEFSWQVQYKAAWAKRVVVVAPLFFPSTKRCSACGTVKASMPLSARIFACDACPHIADRDANSAINLAWFAQHSELVHEQYSVQHTKKPELASAERPSRVARAGVPQRGLRPLRSREGIGGKSKDSAGSPENGQR